MPPEVSSQSPSPEQTTGGAQYYIEPVEAVESVTKKKVQIHLKEQRDWNGVNVMV